MMEWIISSSVLILIVLAMRWLLKGKISSRLQYGLWGLVLLRLLVPVSFFDSPISVSNLARQPGVQMVEQIAKTELPKQSYSAAYEQLLQEYEAQGVDVGSLAGSQLEALGDEAMERMESDVSLADAAMAVWIAGCVTVLAVIGISNFHFRARLRRDRRRLDVPNTSLPVYVSESVESSCLFGMFRPTIYLTPDVAEDEVKMRHVLQHELTHYYHGDYITAPLRCAALVLHWYNPLVWIGAKVSRQDSELACDEGTIARLGEEERIGYGRTLVQLTCEGVGSKEIMLTATSMNGGVKSIRERVSRIAMQPKMAVYTIVAVILVAAVAVGCTFTGAKKPTGNEDILARLNSEGQSHLNKIAVVQLDEGSWGTDGVAIFLPNEIEMDYFSANVGGTDRNGNVVSLQSEIEWKPGEWVIVEDLEQYQELILMAFYNIDLEDTSPDKQRNVDLLHLEEAAKNRQSGANFEGNLEKVLMENLIVALGFPEDESAEAVTAASYGLPKLVKPVQEDRYLFEISGNYVLSGGETMEQVVYVSMAYDGEWELVGTITPAKQAENGSEPVETQAQSESGDAEVTITEVLTDVEDQNVPVTLALNGADRYEGRLVSNAENYSRSITRGTYTPAEMAMELSGGGEEIVLELDGDRSLRFYSEGFVMLDNGDERSLYHTDQYETVRHWFDEAELEALGGSYYSQNAIVIEDRGQDYLAAAQEYCEAFEGVHLEVSPGSSFKYSFVMCSVEAAEDQTEHMCQMGELDDNTWCFYLTTVFVPENEQALAYSMAGNTREYEGEDGSVPEGAFEYLRCGYITRADGGWHCEIVGTGW